MYGGDGEKEVIRKSTHYQGLVNTINILYSSKRTHDNRDRKIRPLLQANRSTEKMSRNISRHNLFYRWQRKFLDEWNTH